MYKMLGYVILILVAGFLIYMARMGSRRGVIKLLYALVSIVLCMTVSAALTNPVASFLKKETGIYKGIYKSVDAYVKENIEESMQESGGDVVELLNDGTVLPKELAKNIIIATKQSTELAIVSIRTCSSFIFFHFLYTFLFFPGICFQTQITPLLFLHTFPCISTETDISLSIL